MKSYLIILLGFISVLILNLSNGIKANQTGDLETNDGKLSTFKYDNSDEIGGNIEDDAGDDSIEYHQLGPHDIEAYLQQRSLKQGFNPWAGRRSVNGGNRAVLGLFGYRIKNIPLKNYFKIRERRRPWGGSA